MTDIVERLWAGIDVRGPDECWPWKRALTKYGYSRFQLPGKRGTTAHRVVWSTMFGDPGELQVCHSCDNRRCCNPSHLFLGTAKENAEDKVSKGRQSRLRGAANASAKLTENDVIEIRKSKAPHSAIAKKFRVSEANVRMIRSRETWSHV